MIVEEQHIITISYEVRDVDHGGELLERMDANWPFHFLYGTGKLLSTFEENLRGLEEGDTFDFTLKPADAYGPVEQGNIIELEREIFRRSSGISDEAISIGSFVQLTDDQGDTHQGKILAFTDEKVKVDFNHSMAGKTLRFKGVILRIRKASVDELVRKHYIQDDGVRRS